MLDVLTGPELELVSGDDDEPVVVEGLDVAPKTPVVAFS